MFLPFLCLALAAAAKARAFTFVDDSGVLQPFPADISDASDPEWIQEAAEALKNRHSGGFEAHGGSTLARPAHLARGRHYRLPEEEASSSRSISSSSSPQWLAAVSDGVRRVFTGGNSAQNANGETLARLAADDAAAELEETERAERDNAAAQPVDEVQIIPSPWKTDAAANHAAERRETKEEPEEKFAVDESNGGEEVSAELEAAKESAIAAAALAKGGAEVAENIQ